MAEKDWVEDVWDDAGISHRPHPTDPRRTLCGIRMTQPMESLYRLRLCDDCGALDA
jgi:hypothetical protein